MQNNYLLSETENGLQYSPVALLDEHSIKAIVSPLRLKILSLLSKKPMYPVEIAKKLDVHEQTIYYHIKQMHDAGLLDIIERKEIRGTIAKKYHPKFINFALSLSDQWKPFAELNKELDKKTLAFFEPFVEEGRLNSTIVVGSPDPHGPFKSRARDGHYAIELSLFMGGFCSISKDFSVKLDVDIDLAEKNNFIIVGGPVTNMVCMKVNERLPARFSDKRPWGIISKTATYTDDSVGLICRIPNPFNPDGMLLVIAGIRFLGTKAAVMAITRNLQQVLNRYTGQKEFFCIVQGFDIDGDGKIDSVEVLE